MFILKMTGMELLVRLVIFFIGIFILSFGIVLIIEANLGVPSWDVLHIGLYKSLGLTVGTWSQIVGLVIILITLAINRKIISIGTVLNMVFIGFFIDFFLHIIPKMTVSFFQYLFLFSGLLVIGIGSGLYITASLGPGPRDSLMLALTKRYNWSIGKVKTAMELVVLMIGWILGGPVFIGTLIFVILIGPIMDISLKWSNRILTPLFEYIKGLSPIKKDYSKNEEIL